MAIMSRAYTYKLYVNAMDISEDNTGKWTSWEKMSQSPVNWLDHLLD